MTSYCKAVVNIANFDLLNPATKAKVQAAKCYKDFKVMNRWPPSNWNDNLCNLDENVQICNVDGSFAAISKL